jgi:hypothetical protein
VKFCMVYILRFNSIPRLLGFSFSFFFKPKSSILIPRNN